MAQRFRIGVNYWPRSSAMQWWNRFDPLEVRDDFQRIAASGCDCVRFFLLWPHFQPDPKRVDGTMLERLVTVVRIAEACHLDVMPTLFTGHMSGVNWIPGWAIDDRVSKQRFRLVSEAGFHAGTPRNWFTDDFVLEAQVLHATEVAGALAGASNLWAWDLGNENSNCCIPPSRAAAINWLQRISEALRTQTPEAKVTIGLHMEDLEEDRRLGPREASKICDFLCMHGYPIYASFAHGPTDARLVPFLSRLTSWLGDSARVLFTEFGLPTRRPGGETSTIFELTTEQDAATYTADVLHGLWRTGALGALLWCYGDYDPEIFTEPPLDLATHERSFGLWRADGTPKAAVQVLRRFAETSPSVQPQLGIPTTATESVRRYHDSPGESLARLYRRTAT